MKKFVLIAAAITSLGLAACNTVAGAGEDMQAAGTAVKDTAKDAQN